MCKLLTLTPYQSIYTSLNPLAMAMLAKWCSKREVVGKSSDFAFEAGFRGDFSFLVRAQVSQNGITFCLLPLMTLKSFGQVLKKGRWSEKARISHLRRGLEGTFLFLSEVRQVSQNGITFCLLGAHCSTPLMTLKNFCQFSD